MAPQRKRSPGRSLGEVAVVAVIAVGLAFAIQAWVVKPYKVPSGSMEPTLTPGQRIFVDRLTLHWSAPRIGDIMVFHPPADYAICADPDQGAVDGGPAPRQACDRAGRSASAETFVKRVVGLPGDHLRIIAGAVIRNGRREADPAAVPCPDNAACSFPGTIVVPAGDYYMMGDNRPDSDDSRFWGPVPRSWLIGYVFFRYWPLSRFGTV